MNEETLISIIIPTYNRAHLISQTLDSVLLQTHQNWECIIVDDGSDDNTAAILSEYCKKDSRIQYFNRPENYKAGGSGARNYGLKMSKGHFINWLDSDDLLDFEKLEIDLKSLLKTNKDFTISQSKYFHIEKDDFNLVWNERLYSKDPINDFIIFEIGWAACAPLWRRKSLKKYGIKFDENLSNGQDFMYHILALENKLEPIIINKTLTYLRQHANKIESKVIKASSKAIVNLYLLKKSKSLGLNANTLKFLDKQSLKILKSMYKHKLWLEALVFSINRMKIAPKLNWLFLSILYFVFGSFYFLFSVGYKYLD